MLGKKISRKRGKRIMIFGGNSFQLQIFFSNKKYTGSSLKKLKLFRGCQKIQMITAKDLMDYAVCEARNARQMKENWELKKYLKNIDLTCFKKLKLKSDLDV